MAVGLSPALRTLIVCLACALASPAIALQPLKGEDESLKACEKSVCEIILGKEPKGKNPTCNITKTWAKSTIKQGESSAVTWAFGDTRCQADLKVERSEMIAALTRDKFTLRVPTQTVRCVVEKDGQPQKVTAMAAPKLKFKKGKADKIWINLEKIEGPENVTGTISTIAAMEDKIGIFHSSLVKSVNKFIHKRCAKKYGPDAETADADDAPKGKDKVKDKDKPKADGKKADAQQPVAEKAAATAPAAKPTEPVKAKATP